MSTYKFHRFTDPSYYLSAGFPGIVDPDTDYDRVNVISGGTGSGGSAYADGAKSGGTNDGTYFHAWGEDGTTANFNRGMKALSQNTDHLDDLMHRSLASPTIASITGGGSPITSVVLPVGTYLGPGGLTNDQAGLNILFSLVDTSDNDIILSDGTHIVPDHVDVTSAAILTGVGGFSTATVTVTFNSTGIPTGLSARVYYGARSNLATLPADAFTSIKIRGAQEVAAPVENLFRLLHGNGEDWNAAWETTIWDLTVGGLNERYRHRAVAAQSSTPESFFPSTVAKDTAGVGSWYYRDGLSMAGYSACGSHGAMYSDPLNALWAAKFRDSASCGTVGFVAYGKRSFIPGPQEGAMQGLAGFLHIVEHFSGGSDSSRYTTVRANAPATIQRTGGHIELILTNGSDWWASDHSDGFGLSTGVAPGYDMVALTWSGGPTVPLTFIISQVIDATKVYLVDTTGSVLSSVPASVTSATITVWHSTMFATGDGSGMDGGGTFSVAPLSRGLFYSALPHMRTGAEVGEHAYAQFFASDLDMTLAAGLSVPTSMALAWGGFERRMGSTPGYKVKAALLGDGTVDALGYATPPVTTTLTGGAVTGLTWSTGYSLFIDLTDNTGFYPNTSLSWGDAVAPRSGSKVSMMIRRPIGSKVAYISSVTPPTGMTYHFSGTDLLLPEVISTSYSYDLYEGFVWGTHIFWSVKRYQV